MFANGGKRTIQWGSDRGSVTLEFVMAFPVVLTLIMGAAQFGHIWMARQVVSYAAYAAGRTALICHDSERDQACRQAAEEVCAWVSIGQASGEAEKKIPGWGKIPGSGAVKRKTDITIEDLDDWTVKVTVDFDFALVMPIAGAVIGWAVNPNEWVEQQADVTGDKHRQQDSIGYPHLRFSETSIVCKPYKTMPSNNVPSGGW